jgi:hypothetical protein
MKDIAFKKDNYKCVCCQEGAQACVSLLDPRLFENNAGESVENWVSVCEKHKEEVENYVWSPEKLREVSGRALILPEHFYEDQNYDRFGNIRMANGQLLKGDLFEEMDVQAALRAAGMLSEFTTRVKYNRTNHLPWSLGRTEDDKVLKNLSVFQGRRVVVTEKMDGENTTLYSDGLHARSVDSKNHPSRNWLKSFHAGMQSDIPEGWRVCGENMFARHSIGYEELSSYFLGFSVWNEKNVCLSWGETEEWFHLLGVEPVRVLYQGVWDEEKIKALWNESMSEKMEGYVVRTEDAFPYGKFKENVAKFVRPTHVQTQTHWMHQEVVPNGLKDTPKRKMKP